MVVNFYLPTKNLIISRNFFWSLMHCRWVLQLVLYICLIESKFFAHILGNYCSQPIMPTFILSWSHWAVLRFKFVLSVYFYCQIFFLLLTLLFLYLSCFSGHSPISTSPLTPTLLLPHLLCFFLFPLLSTSLFSPLPSTSPFYSPLPPFYLLSTTQVPLSGARE